MTIFYIITKIRAAGGAVGQQGAPPCYSSLWETLYQALDCMYRLVIKINDVNNTQVIIAEISSDNIWQ